MSEKELTELIEKIKLRRLELGLSYQELSDLTGINKSTLQRYETGFIKKVPINQVQIIAKALNVTPGYLMGWENDNENQTYYLNPEAAKMAQEIRPFLKINDSFKKIVITSDIPKPFYNNQGILIMNVYDFLLNADSLEL